MDGDHRQFIGNLGRSLPLPRCRAAQPVMYHTSDVSTTRMDKGEESILLGAGAKPAPMVPPIQVELRHEVRPVRHSLHVLLRRDDACKQAGDAAGRGAGHPFALNCASAPHTLPSR